MWPYEELARRRDEVAPRTWALVYQQQASGMPDAPFSLETLAASRDKSFAVGDRASHLTVALGVDPALAGRTGLVVVGLDRKSGTRYIIDAKADRLLQPDRVKDTIVAFAARYRAQECRIEKNAMQGFLSRDSDLRDRLHAVGCRLTEEYTGRGNKYDPQWVVASVAAKFDAGAFRIPWGGTSPTKMRPLIEELASWRPGVKLVQDLVMALWFAELSCRGLERTVTFQNTRAVGIPGFVLDMRKPERWW